ncbi:MAG: hypothetical protein NWF01_09565 [Candidatus Bathyarchaeota archaeon]|nr:hypothetical protein [Candidatus Bathyarchaeota archaeon]
METSVATLLLVTAAVLFAVVAINYTVDIFQQFTNIEDNPQLSMINSLEESLLNQTSLLYNQTIPAIPNNPP